MVEVKGAYMHGTYENIWLKSWHVITNAKVFTMQDGPTAGQTNKTV